MKRSLPLVAAAFAVVFAWVVPLGEAPDELAHLRYAEALAAGSLPAPWNGSASGYEAHQPPFGYLLPALALAGAGGVNVDPSGNRDLDFNTSGSRAFLPPFSGPRDRIVLRLARATQALWMALTVWAGMALADGRRAALGYLLAPQLLFLSGAINNDAALVACSSFALLLLVRFAATGEHGVAAGLLVVAALFTKASALFLLAPVGVAALLVPAGAPGPAARLSPRARLLAVTFAGLIACWAFQFGRFGSLTPVIPTASHVATLGELVARPWWLVSLFGSFWAKFGWLNTPMAWPFYLWFAVLGLAALLGIRRLGRSERWVLGSALVANFALLLIYLLTIDMQPQGRYLLPSVAALAAMGSAAVPARRQNVVAAIAASVALAALVTIALAYS